MSRRWSEQLAERYRLQLPADLAAWFDEELWQQQAGGEFHCPLEPAKLLDPPPGLIWAGFLPADMLPLISNDYGDLLCLRVGQGESIREIVAWRHGGGDWLPYGRTLSEALVYDAVIGSPYSQQEQFVDREEIDSVERYTFAEWALRYLEPPGSTPWPSDWTDPRWTPMLTEAGYAADCLSRDACLMHLHTPLRESRSVKVARELELPWSPEFVSWQFDGTRIPGPIQARLADKLQEPLDSLSAQDWLQAASHAQRVIDRRSDLGWAWDTLGWQAEREGKLQHAIAAYLEGLHASQFADQAIDFRTHWFDESFAKFSAWRLYELRDHLSMDQRADSYLQIFHAADELMLRQRVGDHWLAAAGQAEEVEEYRTSYYCYQRAGWDVGLQRIPDYEQVLRGMIRTASGVGDHARAEVAKVHLAAM